MKHQGKTAALCRAAMICALYVALTWVCGLLGLANMPVQLRLAEALCVLPFFMPEAIAGLTVGCLVANFLVGCIWQDILFGTLATLLGALGTYAMRHLRGKFRFLAVLPPIVANTVIVPFVLRYAYGIGDGWLVLAAGVGAGEIVSVGVLGIFLMLALEKQPFWRKS